jgi:hypothetical protein
MLVLAGRRLEDELPGGQGRAGLAGVLSRLMRTLEAQGHAVAALAVYEELRLRLRDELGTAPGAATQALHEHLLV